MNRKSFVCCVAAAGCALVAAGAGDNLDYWLDRAQPLPTQPADSQPVEEQASSAPAGDEDAAALGEGVPGVVELSNGKVLAGLLHTTRDRPWAVYVEDERRWRLLPPLAVLSITAIVDEERMEAEWRWAGMGRPERVYTGGRYPFRRYRWRFCLIDGSEVVGAVKGQPLWVVAEGHKSGPYALGERDKGPVGTTLEQLIYVKRVIISRRAMMQVTSQPSDSEPETSGR